MPSRLNDAVLGKGILNPTGMTILNPMHSGQNGYALNLQKLVSSQSQVDRDIIFLVLELPGFLNYLPGGVDLQRMFRAVFEECPTTISGFKGGLEGTFDGPPIGGTGQTQDELTNVTRPVTAPVFGFHDKTGRPIYRLLELWMRWGGMDPDSKIAAITTLNGARPKDLLLDNTTMSGIAILPDATGRYCQDAWLCANMFPRSTGSYEAGRDLPNAKKLAVYDVEFTAVTQFNDGTRLLGQQLLDKINFNYAAPSLQPAFLAGASKDVEAAATVGYKAGVEQLGATALRF